MVFLFLKKEKKKRDKTKSNDEEVKNGTQNISDVGCGSTTIASGNGYVHGELVTALQGTPNGGSMAAHQWAMWMPRSF